MPEIDLQPVTEVVQDCFDDRSWSRASAGSASPWSACRIWSSRCDDVEPVDVVGRGRPLRHHPTLADGANVNFVSRGTADGRWRIRTYERGVEAETLACGTARSRRRSCWRHGARPVGSCRARDQIRSVAAGAHCDREG